MLKIFVLLYAALLLVIAHTLSISEYELQALSLHNLSSFLNSSALRLLGPNYAKLLSVVLIFLAAVLVYKITALKLQRLSFVNSKYASVVFLLSPGVLACALLLDETALLLCVIMLLAFIKEQSNSNELFNLLAFWVLMLLVMFISQASVVFYLGVVVYFHLNRKHLEFCLALALLIVSLFYYELDFGGKPKGYFLEYLALCAAVFSPPLFLYYFYYIYSFIKNKQKDFLSCISVVALVLSLALSIRQRPEATMFLPLLPLAIAPMCAQFIKDYYVHIGACKLRYKVSFVFVICSLVFADLFILGACLSRAEFLSDYQGSKEFAKQLKVISPDSARAKVFELYGVKLRKNAPKVLYQNKHLKLEKR